MDAMRLEQIIQLNRNSMPICSRRLDLLSAGSGAGYDYADLRFRAAFSGFSSPLEALFSASIRLTTLLASGLSLFGFSIFCPKVDRAFASVQVSQFWFMPFGSNQLLGISRTQTRVH